MSARSHFALPPFVGTENRGHPLVGRVWDVRKHQTSSPDSLVHAAIDARFVLIGETHDDADHHAIQASIVRAMLDAGRKPSLVLEMIDDDAQADVDAAMTKAPLDVDAIARAARWESSGWPAWSMYAPIVSAVRSKGLPVIAGNVPLREIRTLVKQGVDALPPGRGGRWLLDAPFDEGLRSSLEKELVDAHCGMLHAGSKVVTAMALAERARDANMARHLAEARGDGAVLIAGSGHGRSDRGVPWALRMIDPKANVLSIGLIEVDAAVSDPEGYATRFAVSALPFDFVVFTPAPVRGDPCEGMRGGK